MKIYSNVISCFPIGKFDTFYINYSSVFSVNKYLMQEKYFLLVFHSKNKNIIFLYTLIKYSVFFCSRLYIYIYQL